MPHYNFCARRYPFLISLLTLDSLQEINKIIQELWLLTYKGEDISSIEIESGHESGTGAKVRVGRVSCALVSD